MKDMNQLAQISFLEETDYFRGTELTAYKLITGVPEFDSKHTYSIVYSTKENLMEPKSRIFWTYASSEMMRYVDFEMVFEAVPEHIKEQMLFYLEILK